jgi:MoaA/NifB/PqqE/SkfB family radical SAM enzyme
MRLIAKPVLCNYYVTYRCNATCGFCDIWEKPSPYIDIDHARKNLLDLRKLGVKVIDFTGGEPLLHRELSSLLKEAKDLGFVTTITTNCLLYPKRARELKDLIDMLHFSLDSGMKNVHDEMRGVACFDKVMESIEIARSLQERPDILFTAFDHNLDQIEKIYHEIVLPNDLVLILNPSFSYNNVKASLNEKSLKILSTWSNKKNIYLNKAFIELRRNGGNHIENPVCKAASSTIVISPENKLILPCYHLGIQEFPINGDLFSLYHSSEVQHLAALEGKLPECEGCTINCYMQPSFAVEMNKYWWMALPSTIKYNAIKGTWKSALKAF